ncbi:hypothetical protein C8F04DRAFT_1194764 [Mycena alexandri]|uniref:Uncharacterized protein n=1 Tax=Mycena alexandri TaxID=1745969 RepID=A0AAD6SB08_9AGAR|nr:hypothetical protein C8F04DRAFT_1194764 [Mycena alexandri]
MSKRKANASIPVVDASSPDAPWTFFWPSQCFSDIIHYFDQENIDNSNSANVMPILNAMRPLLAEFHKKFTNWPADVAAYVAAISIASRQLIRLHLGKPSFPAYQDLFWNYPKDLEKFCCQGYSTRLGLRTAALQAEIQGPSVFGQDRRRWQWQ